MSRAIMIVEDDVDGRESLAEILMDAGYEVLAAAHGKEALELLGRAAEPPAVILLDLMMPIMDGWEFRSAQLQHERWATVPVVVMSAVGDGESKARAIRPAEYLKKPLDLEKVLEVAERYAGRSPGA